MEPMPENAVPQVSGTNLDKANMASQAEALVNAQAKIDAKVQEARQVEVEKKPQPVAAKPAEPEVKQMTKGVSDIFLRYHIDPDTKDETLYVLDRASHKVVRTIPPEELNTLSEGELVELFA
jgi:uncharacterized FlaG/YvyC family protein